ncbi:MAG: hypothetical protein WA637_20320 [Terriglobales bacterium]
MVKRRSPTLEGFRIMFGRPLVGLAEIAWRWTFGMAAAAVLLFSLREYLATLPVTAGEMLLLRTRQPVLVLQALAGIFQGSAPRAVAAFVVLVLALGLAWIVIASLGRAATLETLIEYCRGSRGRVRLTSLLVLNSLRAATFLAATVGVVGALLIARAASSPDDPSPGSVLLIFWTVAMLVGLAWLLLNWYLSLAAIFVVKDGASTFAALAAATDLCRSRPGSVAAAATWFGVAHTVMFVLATSAAAFPLGFADVLPGGMVVGGLLLVTLLYFAVVDFLYVGRLAAYVFMIEPSSVTPQPQSDDDILSDIPGLQTLTTEN